VLPETLPFFLDQQQLLRLRWAASRSASRRRRRRRRLRLLGRSRLLCRQLRLRRLLLCLPMLAFDILFVSLSLRK
jgi:hypothetical protein